MSRPARVLHCAYNQTGHAYQLSRAERARGFDSRLVTLAPERYQYPVDEVLSTKGSELGIEVARVRLLARALSWADIVHFNFGTGVTRPWLGPPEPGASLGRQMRSLVGRALSLRELPLLYAAGARVFVTFEGSDVRPSTSSLLVDDELAAEALRSFYDQRRDGAKARTLRHFERWSDGMFVLTPDLLAYANSAVYTQCASVNPAAVPVLGPSGGKRIKIVHAPTQQSIKGSRFILAAIDELRQEGWPLDLEFIERMTHEQAMAAFRSADLVIDQAVIGWYGVVAIEAMAMAKPVACYVAPAARAYAPSAMDAQLPVVTIRPSTMAADLRQFLHLGQESWKAIGAAGRTFVERWHAPEVAASITCEAYERALEGVRRHGVESAK